MRMAVPILAAALALSACGQGHEPAARSASATIRLPAVPGRPGAGYFDLVVQEDRGALTSVTSPQIGRIEMHETMRSGTMSAMRPIARVPAPRGARISFAPGGRHLMLFEIASTVRPGSRVGLVLHFERGGDLPLTASAVAPGGEHH
jgi:copper(I)-binding protein